MTSDDENRIKSLSLDDAIKLALRLTEENEKLRVRVYDVSKNSYDLCNSYICRGLVKEFRLAAKECLQFAEYYEGVDVSLPNGTHLKKFIIF